MALGKSLDVKANLFRITKSVRGEKYEPCDYSLMFIVGRVVFKGSSREAEPLCLELIALSKSW